MKLYPDARRLDTGEIVAFDTGEPLPNFTGPVYAEPLPKQPYILWATAQDDSGQRQFRVINQGSTIVQTELDRFIKEELNFPYRVSEPVVSPHQHSRNSRVFDVEIVHGEMDPIGGSLGFGFPVVANSFAQASVAAVDYANAKLKTLKEAADETDSIRELRLFVPVDITKMEVVRSNVTVFRHR